MGNKWNQQSYEVPNSKKPGQTSIYRNAQSTELKESFSPQVTTIIDCFNAGLKISKDRPCIGSRPLTKTGVRGPYVWQSYREINHRLTHFGSGVLNHLNHTMGDSRTRQIPIGIWAVNRPEWAITDLALSAYALYTVALYDTLGPDTVEFVINHAEIETVVCSGNHVHDLLKMKHRIPQLKTIISMDSVNNDALKSWAEEKQVTLLDFEAVELLGKKNRRSYNRPLPDDLACIMYTSGTTGMPKGAMLSHRNVVAAVSACYTDVGGNKNDTIISYLPLAHIFGRLNDLAGFTMGCRVGYFSGNMDTLVDDIQTLKPTIFPSVPRLLNRVYAKLRASTVDAPGLTGVLSRRAMDTKIRQLEAGQGSTHPVWDRLIFNKAKQALGGNVRMIFTGSAPIGRDVLQFLRVAFCCEVREGYGATETCAASIIHRPKEFLAGHVGGPFICNEVKLVDVPEMDYLSTDPQPRGEICIRGPNIFRGYYKDEEKTRECIDSEGWFHTGDIGLIDERSAFVIIDRKKNIFKLAQGEYIAPEKIENIYSKNPVVGQIYMHGDSLESCLVGIVVPDPDALSSLVAAKLPHLYAKKLDYTELCKNQEVNTLVLSQMTAVGQQAKLRGFEFAKSIHLESTPFTIENDLLTPTFKVKRAQAKKHYESRIAELYQNINAPKAKL
ncbi:hypothetical protein BY458DRAFT_457727 [Sporodiniella umbellata]|nr:hypothetical protein BY458DRAFT_457727 [Sporodiniella umbellata]